MIDVAESVEELLTGATMREPMKTADSLSGSRFERVVVGGRRLVVKYICLDDDWIMRATGDLYGRQLQLWRSPLTARLPAEIDPALVGCSDYQPPGGHRGIALLLADVTEQLVPAGDDPIDAEQELRFLDHMAALHASLWGWRDDLGLTPTSHHYTMLTPTMSALESLRAAADPVPPLVGDGWRLLPQAAGRTADLLCGLVDDPRPLVEALRGTPTTFVHGDWKLGNLGSHPDGRTVLLDWDRCGEGPGCLDLAWYLAVNCDRLARSKEAAIDVYRGALERRGIDTSGWWDRQLGLALIGALLQLGWSKALGGGPELAWWEERAEDARRFLN